MHNSTAGRWTSQSIDHSCIQDNYTKYVSHLRKCTSILLADGLMGCNGVAWIYGHLAGEV